MCQTPIKMNLALLVATALAMLCGSQAVPFKIGVVGSLSLTDANGNPLVWVPQLRPFHVMYVLAAKHFNDRNPVFVPQFAELGSCNKTIEMATGVMLDDHGKTADSVRAVLNAHNSNTGLHLVIGSLTSIITVPLSLASNALNLPTIGARSTASAFSDKTIHPLFARTVPSVVSVAAAMAIAFEQWNLKHVGVS
jgi:ABC-type branched-subunit amino acid transport system substrate-binding protein